MAKGSPLKLLILTFEGDMAGSTNSIAYLAKGLAQKGHDVFMGLRKEALLWQLLEGSGVHRIAMTFKGKFDQNNWRQIRDLVWLHGIQIINAQSSKDRYTSIFAKWFFRLPVKVIHTRRQMPMSSGGPLQLYLYNKRTDGIVAVSKQVANGLVDLGIKENHIKVIYNGTPREKYKSVDSELTASLRKELGISSDDFVVGCVSRMKNQIQIVKALALLTEPVTMIFCGIEANNEMKEIMESYPVPHKLHFIDQVPGNEILSYYGLFDIKVLASTMEGLSQSLLEAMALGIPVVGTAYAGNLDLIEEGKNGLLFEDGDIEKLADQIKKLQNNQALRTAFSETGKKTALEKFSIENTVRNYEEYFYRLIKE